MSKRTGAIKGRALQLLIKDEALSVLDEMGMEAEVHLLARNGEPAPSQVLQQVLDRLESDSKRASVSQHLAALGELGASVIHETRNIMTGVLGLSQVGGRGNQPPAELQKLFRRMEKELFRCVDMFSNFLDFSRIDSGIVERLDPADIVLPAVELASSKARARQVRIQTELKENVPSLMGQSTQLRQVVLNLLINAVQALEEGGTVEVRVQAVGGKVRIEVIDDGPGVSKEMQARVFDSFFTTKKEGTGLGLALSRRIVEAHGGELTLRSRPGHGAVFTIELPVASKPGPRPPRP